MTTTVAGADLLAHHRSSSPTSLHGHTSGHRPRGEKGESMLYLLRPDGSMGWANDVGGSLRQIAAEGTNDLSAWPWDPAERVVDSAALRVALRHGVAIPAGIIVDGGLVVQQGDAAKLRATHEDLKASRAALDRANGDFLEAVNPGSRASGHEINRRVDETVETTAARFDVKAGRVVSGPADPGLVAHWQHLGGMLPDPL